MQVIKIVGLLILAGILTIIAMVLMKVAPRIQPITAPTVTSFEECAAAGNPVMESYPRQCRTQGGALFVEEILQPQTPVGNATSTFNGCAVAGCSGQVCVSADIADSIITTCEYRTEYACFRDATCEPQADGVCGWTETPELQQCLAKPPEAGTELKLEVM